LLDVPNIAIGDLAQPSNSLRAHRLVAVLFERVSILGTVYYCYLKCISKPDSR
jgi:hypothetical protein